MHIKLSTNKRCKNHFQGQRNTNMHIENNSAEVWHLFVKKTTIAFKMLVKGYRRRLLFSSFKRNIASIHFNGRKEERHHLNFLNVKFVCVCVFKRKWRVFVKSAPKPALKKHLRYSWKLVQVCVFNVR